ncbi:MAG: heme o synthase [Chlamydiales bacterium]|nr:heme o synthase [Chlamydiales bacterium]
MINYYLLTKPGIIMGNLITVAAGFLLASRGTIDFGLFLATLLGLSCIIASACVFNNYIDRKIDKKMVRTKDRALAKGIISHKNAIVFAIALGLLGNLILSLYTNLLTVCITNIGFFTYVLLYSIWKRHTIYGTAIGSIAGAVPPVVGYCAVSNHFDIGAAILFFIMVLWQMPHFFSIAIYRLGDYTKASIPVLPVMRGINRTKFHMTIYIIGFIVAAILLTTFHYTGYAYLIIATLLGLLWLALCIRGFKCDNDQVWARSMFRLSLVVITALCITIPFDIYTS